tara:strand:+ start:1333 stop:1857 length:525 start_codon:yes stop_codon:yes gene_type:complete
MRFNRFLIASAIALFIIGCDASHHIQKIEKHRQIAENKGAIFSPDTLWKYEIQHDTIINEISGETIFVPRVDSVAYSVDRLIYVPMSRQERLAHKDSLRYLLKNLREFGDQYADSLREARKMNNSDNRKEKAITRIENRSSWWKFWISLGFILGIIAFYYGVRYIPLLKRILSL